VITLEVRPLQRRAFTIMFEVAAHARTSSVCACPLGTSPRVFRRRPHRAAALLIALACGGCASFSPDGGMSLVNGIVAPELKSEVVKSNGEDVAGGAQARGARLLGATLSADGSVRIALLNNKGLQASYKELGIAEAGWSKQACRQIRHFR
jgi:hypothetical protein